MKRLFFVLSVLTIGNFTIANSAIAREQLRIVGSSTVYPFVTVVAEEFGTRTDFRTPIVESTGTGGGFKLFCSGVGENTPDLVNASRRIKKSEIKYCAANGVGEPLEIKIGYDGIVIANSKDAPQFNLTKKELFLALAKKIPVDGKLTLNPNKNWQDINKDLPDQKIAIYGPPPTSGTRDAFVEIVMEKACEEFKEFEEEYPNKDYRKKECKQIREDGGYIESGENDNLIVQKLKNNVNTLGVFGYSFLEQNSGDIQGSRINDVEPNFDDIADGAYGISRSLYVYAKKEHINTIPGFGEFLKELVSEDAASESGYLAIKGLISLRENEVTANQKIVAEAIADNSESAE